VHLAGLHLARTLASGQAFRWTWRGPVAEGVVGASVWHLRPAPGGLRASAVGEPVTPERVRRYLLGWGPLEPLEAQLAQDPVLAQVLRYTRGLSVLDQDPWEVLATFVVSQNNNIPKIARSVARLCEALGEPIGRPPVAWAFPAADRLAAAPDSLLEAALLGYRAPYLKEVARRVARGEVDLLRLRTLPTDEARAALLELPGVGEKVADCVLLFGLGHRAVFPVDVWVKKVVEELYFGGRPAPPRRIRAWAVDRFGPLAGLAQQHLYCYGRQRLRRARAGLQDRGEDGPRAPDRTG